MNLPELLLALGRAGVEVATGPDGLSGLVGPGVPVQLRFRPATLNPSLRAALGVHKQSMVGLLNGASVENIDSDVLTERLGIAEDLKMPTHPGSPAWMVAHGEAMPALASAGRSEPVEINIARRLAERLGIAPRLQRCHPGKRFPGEPEWLAVLPARQHRESSSTSLEASSMQGLECHGAHSRPTAGEATQWQA